MDADFLYLKELVEGFFNQRRVGKALSIIEDQEISGWEVWFQIEFAHFLSQHDSEPEWWREYRVDLDRRVEKLRGFCRPDFIIRKKGWLRESFAALEIKQNPDPSRCFAMMMKDCVKIEKVKESSLHMRSYRVLGIHRREPKQKLREMIGSRLKNGGWDDEGVMIKYIPGSNYACSMF